MISTAQTNLPRPSRRRAILWLEKPAPLFDMREQEITSLNDLLSSSREARPILFVHVICIHRSSNLSGGRMKEVVVHFLGGKTSTNDYFFFETKLVAPWSWPSQNFLALIDQSIQLYQIISLDNSNITGRKCCILNETFINFSMSAQDAKDKYSRTFNIEGGELWCCRALLFCLI